MNKKELRSLVKQTRDKNIINIINSVSHVLLIDKKDIYSSRRLRHLVDARRLCYVLIREVFNYPYMQIAKHFNKNHATIIHQIKVHETLINYDKSYYNNYLKIKNLLIDDTGFNSQNILINEKNYYLSKLNEINIKLMSNEQNKS